MRHRSLLARIALSFFLLSSLIVVLLIGLSFAFFVQGTRSRVTEQMEGIAATKELALTQWVDERVRDVMTLTTLAQVTDNAAVLCSPASSPEAAQEAGSRLRAFFATVGMYQSELSEVLVLSDRGGLVVFSTQRSSEGQYRGQDTYFTLGKKATHVGAVAPSPVDLDPTLTISTPLYAPTGAAFAVLAANLDLDTMDRVAEDRTGLGKGGEAYLVDRYNVFVSSHRFDATAYPRGVHSSGIDAAVSGHSGSALYKNYAGVPVIGVFRWLPERELALMLEIPQAEAFSPVQRMSVVLTLIGLGMALAAAVGVYLLARRIVAPILAVKQAALAVSGGDFGALAPELTQDEIGELAKAFNSMTARVRDLYDEISKKEAHFRALIENSSDIVTVFDEEFRIKFISPSVQKLLGYRPEDVIGTNPTPLIHPDDAERVQAEGVRIGNSPPEWSVPMSFRIACKSGAWRTLEATGRNLLAHPAVNGVLIVLRDVTEQRQLEEKLNQAQKMEAVGRLAGGIAHDFNNLLTAVLGYSDLMLEDGSLAPDARGSVSEIKKAASRAAALTQQLLAYSRKQMLQPRVVDLDLLVANLQNMLRRLIREDIELVIQPGEGNHYVRADPTQIEQVVLNLALNARDAMPSGGSIVFETSRQDLGQDLSSQYPDMSPGSYVVLSVSDTGIGMDAETRSKIFDPFFTTKGAGKGTGLGLATAYGIVKQSGGHISVYSEEGKGSTFRIYLPSSHMTPPREKVEDQFLPHREGSESVLVVEDEEAVRKMICVALEQSGYTVHAEAAPSAALQYAEIASRIDLLISDIVLPGMNGRVMAETMRTRHPEVKVLFISGYSERMAEGQGMPAASEFLQKPFVPAALAAKVRDILDRR